jgi:hypothetical protein
VFPGGLLSNGAFFGALFFSGGVQDKIFRSESRGEVSLREIHRPDARSRGYATSRFRPADRHLRFNRRKAGAGWGRLHG